MRVLLACCCVVVAAAASSCASPKQRPYPTADQIRAQQLQASLTLIRGGVKDPIERRRAAQDLLRRGWSEGIQALAIEMADTHDPAVREAILQALAMTPSAPLDAFTPILWDLLGRSNAATQADLALVLGRNTQEKHVRRVLTTALDDQSSLMLRRGTVFIVGYYRSQEAAAVLMKLIEPDQPAELRDAAFASLSQLTGVTTFGTDANLWNKWWEQHRKLSRERWFMELVDNLGGMIQNMTRHNAHVSNLESRLVETQQQLYLATPAGQRSAMLVTMLADPLEAIRRLGLQLTERRVLDSQPLDQPLRDALLARLGDISADVRKDATVLLWQIGDETAADWVAKRLAAGTETQVIVLQANLLMMARLPRAEAVETCMRLLDVEPLRAEAADALTEAAAAGLLSDDQQQAILKRARSLAQPQPPQPQIVRLLGMVGGTEDWRKITDWLDSRDMLAKRAAAQAWGRSDQPLAELARYADDPIVQPILLEAAARRGQDAKTFLILVDHKPVEDVVLVKWREALVAMAARVPMGVVIEADRRLGNRHEPMELREQMLSAAIDPLLADPKKQAAGEGGKPVLLDLLLQRAEVRLGSTDATTALADYQRATTLGQPLSPRQQARVDRGLVRGRLAAGDVDGAFEAASRLLGSTTGPERTDFTRQLAEWSLAAAQRFAAAQTNVARQILTRVRVMLGSAIPDDLSRQIADLADRIGGGAPPATQPASTTQPAANSPSVAEKR